MNINVDQGYKPWEVDYFKEYHLLNTGVFGIHRSWLQFLIARKTSSVEAYSSYSAIYCLN